MTVFIKKVGNPAQEINIDVNCRSELADFMENTSHDELKSFYLSNELQLIFNSNAEAKGLKDNIYMKLEEAIFPIASIKGTIIVARINNSDKIVELSDEDRDTIDMLFDQGVQDILADEYGA